MKKRLKQLKLNKGTTMAEVLVGFAFLMVMMASLSQIIKVSNEMLMKSTDQIRLNQTFEEKMFMQTPPTGVMTKIDAAEFKLKLDETKTDMTKNQASPVTVDLTYAGLKKYELEDVENDISVYRFRIYNNQMP